MSRKAWAYVVGIFLAGTLCAGLTLPLPPQSTSEWSTFVILTLLATLAQLFKVEAPKHQTYFITRVFQFASLLLLHPALFVLVVVIAHLAEWLKERLSDSPLLRNWYIQPFNIATHLIAGLIARWVYGSIMAGTLGLLMVSSVLAGSLAALTYVVVNHLIVGQVLVLARGVSWRESGILDVENIITDLVLLLLGYVTAVLWNINAWLVLPALSPLVLMYRALMIPQLKSEAQTDSKTGLWNARHFTTLFKAELKRAQRFDRPLAFIMSDLDLLRNINNTYGHLAGDAVLAGVGKIILETIREYDIAGRFGGEEFAIVLPETELEDARVLAERLRRKIEAAGFEVSTHPMPISATISLGVACFPDDATETSDLIHEADVAVYQAKLRGRNQVMCAVDIPQSVSLDALSSEERLTSAYNHSFVPRPVPSSESAANEADAEVDVAEKPVDNARESTKEEPDATESSRRPVNWVFPGFIGAVVAVGLFATLLGVRVAPLPNLEILVVLIAITAVAELLGLDMNGAHGKSTVSVSAAINFGAAIVAGMPGVACVSATIAGIHFAQVRPEWYKTAFNWSTHVLAGALPTFLIYGVAGPLELHHLLPYLLPLAIGSIGYYAIDTGLVAAAISLSVVTDPVTVWRDQFRWLAHHYFVLCIMGILAAVAYTALGIAGLVVFLVPVFMMRFAQKQYVQRVEASMQELKRMNQELAQANQEIVGASQAIRKLNDDLFLTLSKIVDARDPYVHGHAAKVADYATAIAADMALPAERVEAVRQAAFLHDIGKVVLSERILHKPDSLTEEEYQYVKSHVILGAGFLETSSGLRHLAPFVRHHHERWDGGGYPAGLRGNQIPLEAQILAVCDAVEAMASDRPYHRAMSLGEIVAELRGCAGTHFAPRVVDAFVSLAEQRGDDFVVNSAKEVALQHHDDEDLLYRFNNGWFKLEEPAQATD